MNKGLAVYDAAGLMEKANRLLCDLDKAETVEAVLVVEAKAHVLAGLAKRLGMELAVVNAAVETWLTSLAELGKRLGKNDKGGRPRKTGQKVPGFEDGPAVNRWHHRRALARKLAPHRREIAGYVKAATDAGAIATQSGLLKPHVAQNAGDSEWYTPAEIIEAARAVMGGIDLDPASTETANQVVGANRILEAQDDGAAQEWAGRVWLNPPYSQPAVGDFCKRLVDELGAGRVTEACALVNNATETEFFQVLARAAACICFPSGRVKFWHPEKVSAPLQGQAILYLGPNRERFFEQFKGFGFCVEVRP